MFSGLVAHKAKGQVIPRPFFEKALSAGYMSCAGLASADQGKLVVHKLKIEDTDPTTCADNLMEMQETWKADDLLLYLGKFPNGFHDDDMQPFTLLQDVVEVDGKKTTFPLLISFLEGNYSQHYKAEKPGNTQHSAEYTASCALVEIFATLYSDNDESMDALEGEMNTKLFERTMSSNFGDVGVLAFLTSNGEMTIVQSKDAWKKQEWGGYYSRTFNYEEKTFPDKAAEKPKDTGGFSAFSKKPAAAAPDAPKPEATVPNKTDTAIPASANLPKGIDPSLVEMVPRPSEWGKRDKNWKKAWVRNTTKGIWDPDNLPQTNGKTGSIGWDVTTHFPRLKSNKPAEPLSSAETKKTLAEEFVPKLGDPTKLQELVGKKYPTFSEDAGVTLEATLGASYEWHVELGKANSEALAKRAFELQMEVIKLKAAAAKPIVDAPPADKKTAGFSAFSKKAS